MFLLFIFNLIANPFSIVTKLDKINYAAEEYYKFDITVRSISRKEGLFLLNIELPKSIELLEGNSSYKDLLLNQVQKTITLIINPIKEEEGEIKIKLASYLDNNAIDKTNIKTFSIAYLIFKHKDLLFLKINDAIELVNKKDKVKNISENKEPSDINKDALLDLKEDFISATNPNTQTFVYVKKSNKLRTYRIILFFISILIIVYFVRRIIKNKSY